MRGKVVRAGFQDFKDETARQQWMAYYLELGEYDAAKEYGWEPPPGWTPPAAGEAPAAASSGAAAPMVPPLKFGEAEAGQLAITARAASWPRARSRSSRRGGLGGSSPRSRRAARPRGGEEEESGNSGAGVRAHAARASPSRTSRASARAPRPRAIPPRPPHRRPRRRLRRPARRPRRAAALTAASPLRYRLLALYAHIEEKHATKIQTQFRESRRRKDEAMAELNKQAVEAVETREAPATSVVVAPPPKLTAPPRVKEQTEIDSKVAEVSQASAAAAVAAFYLLLHHLLLATITRHHHLHPTATFATTAPHLLHLRLPADARGHRDPEVAARRFQEGADDRAQGAALQALEHDAALPAPLVLRRRRRGGVRCRAILRNSAQLF